MGYLQQIQDAFGLANDFLTPVLDREQIKKTQGNSLLSILNQAFGSDAASDDVSRPAIIRKALNILAGIHASFASSDGADPSQQLATEGEDMAMEDAKRRRMLHALLDLISLEGIYPSLSSGVGIPLQQRVISVLPAGVIAKQAETVNSSVPRNETLLRQIIDVLMDIIFDPRPGIQPVVRGRILSDIISGTSELAFNPHSTPSYDKGIYQKALVKIIADTPTTVLLPALSNFLQSDIAQWFKSTISGLISHIPLRPGGVVQTIMFIASQFAPSLGQEAQDQSSGPHLTVQAIMQISRLLSSVPQDVDPVVYFGKIAPQLLALIDGEDPDLRKTASYVVGNGVLGKRAYGAPGTIGHSIFVEPIFKALTGELDVKSKRWMTRFSDVEGSMPDFKDVSPGSIITVDGATVILAINRIRCLTLQHPNPGLVKRLVYPILLPLWGLACASQEEQLSTLHELVLPLLHTYFGISVGVQPLKKIVDNLLWDGGLTWTYFKDSDDQLALKKRTEEHGNHSNFIKLINSLQTRAELFVCLLGSDPSSEERTGDIFLYVSEKWLVQPQHSTQSQETLGARPIGESDHLIGSLVSAKVAEKLLENFKDTLSRRPLRVLELIKQVVDGELHKVKAQAASKQKAESGNVSLSNLANIVESENKENDDTPGNDSFESLTTAFSLLSTVIASPDFSPSNDILPLLESLKGGIDQLIPLLPSSLSKPGMTSSMLLEIHIASPEQTGTRSIPAHISDLETHRQALANLNSDLPPVQAEGLSLLSKLIMNSSPVLDVPSSMSILLAVITDTSGVAAPEQYIYLNAIKIVGTLAARHPRTVVKTLIDTYADRSEITNLDERLKVGEALLRTIQDLGEALSGETAKIFGEGLIAVAGRRQLKPQAQKKREQQAEKERRKKDLEERKAREDALPPGWSMSSAINKAATELNIVDEDSDTESPEQAAHASNVVAAWAAGASADEQPDDLRIRASALSILASAIHTNIIGLGPVIVSSAIELALATLTLEPGVESAILRRASAVLILDTLKALESMRETRGGQHIGFGFSLSDQTPPKASNSGAEFTIGNIPTMLRTLGFVESREEDGIARGHLRALIESLETWMEKSMMWGIGANDGQESFYPRFGLSDRIEGLNIDPLGGQDSAGRPRIEEIE
ncbi:hypothetical protein N7508_010591 [Penicillium antarcticum]|uniref:uncharacterized protein n=1 Tax=Penicillium antarcticum TaxID=416450 RepID=UPI0023935C53|nr:uncharacterized protein N7508_010591 [Penicillium antarcticum]KAJ5295770.1 hypothetical protein N7508_010591 [Penicillium antarcticum]